MAKRDSSKMSLDSNSALTMIVLAGGFGTRLRSLDSQNPKPMVVVAGKPFLYWQIQHYVELGYRKFILSTGYKAEVIENYPWESEFPQATFTMVREELPLGTGGAVARIFQQCHLEQAWVINGDTYLPQVLPSAELLPLAVTYCVLPPSAVFDALPNLWVDGNLIVRITDPSKGEPVGQVFDAGAVFVRQHGVLWEDSLTPPYGFHQWVNRALFHRQVGLYELEGTCFDIGTPERYQRFETELKRK